MLEDKIKTSLAFTGEFGKWLDVSLPELIQDVSVTEDLDNFDDEDEPLLSFEGQDILVSEKKIKSKIAEVMLENRINDYLFQQEFSKSSKQDVEGYR